LPGAEFDVPFVCSSATLQQDYEKSARRVNDIEKENADLRAKYENASVQAAQKAQQLTGLVKQIEKTELDLKKVTIENASLRNEVESREYRRAQL
jgi:chromosome segregation ATPase